MEDFDLHGMLVYEAEELFHKILNDARMKGKLREVQFITGVGKIQNRLKELAKEADLYHYVPMGNAGCIVIEFE